MFVRTKMKTFELAVIFSVSLGLSVEYSLARPGQDSEKERGLSHVWAQNKEAIIENKILKGVVDPIDKNRKIGQAIFDVLSNSPDHVSQIQAETGEKTTYREMKDRSIRLALWMKKLGITPKDIVVECSHNHMDSYLPLVATFFIDAIFSAWTTNVRVETAQRFLQQYTPKLIFTDEKTADVLLEAATLEKSDVKIIVFGKHSSLQSFSEIMNIQAKANVASFSLVNEKTPEDAAAILLTSGTTAFPKGVVYSSKSLMAIAMNYQSVYKDVGAPNGGITHLWYIDLSWISGFWFSLQTIVQKDVKIVATLSDRNQYLQTIEKYKVNVAEMPVSFIQSMVSSGPVRNYNVQSLKIIMISGLKFSRQVLGGLHRALPGTFIEYAYGTTEAGGAITLRTRKYKEVEAVGFAVPNSKLRFVDIETHENLGPYKRGEIYCKTATMMIEYYKKPDLTKEAFDAEGWYRTGDLGYYDENGEVFIVGRLKNVIKHKNQMIELPVIQYTLSTHPGVERVAVISIPHETYEAVPVAFVKKVPGSKVTKEELVKLLSVLEKYRDVEIQIYFVEKFPQTGSGKIAESELKQIAEKMANTL